MTDLVRLRTLFEAYGADPKRWPAEEREAATALVAGSAEARAYAREAQILDSLLDRAPLRPDTQVDAAALAARISRTPRLAVSTLPVTPRRREAPTAWNFAFGWPNFAALAAAGLIGFFVGWTDLGTSTSYAGRNDVLDLMTPIVAADDPAW